MQGCIIIIIYKLLFLFLIKKLICLGLLCVNSTYCTKCDASTFLDEGGF